MHAICEEDPEQALVIAAEQQPAAVIVDLQMRKLDGYQFVQRLRSTALGRRTPVLIVSGKELGEYDRKQLNSGPNAVLIKGVELHDALLAELAAWVPMAGRPTPTEPSVPPVVAAHAPRPRRKRNQEGGDSHSR